MRRSKPGGAVETMEVRATAGIRTFALPPKAAVGVGAIGHTTTKSRRKTTIIVTNRFHSGSIATKAYQISVAHETALAVRTAEQFLFLAIRSTGTTLKSEQSVLILDKFCGAGRTYL